MHWTFYIALFALVFCNIACIIHFFRIIGLGKPADLSKKAGNTRKAILYSFTGAMNPAKKESAFLHLPTYSAGIIYHIGTFTSIIVFMLIMIGINIIAPFSTVLIVLFLASGISGAAILVKRIVNHNLRALSNPDDFISNIMVTLYHFVTALMLSRPEILPYYFSLSALLLIYLPVGKLKHTVYFFAARYHLGFFYGWRGVWPPK